MNSPDMQGERNCPFLLHCYHAHSYRVKDSFKGLKAGKVVLSGDIMSQIGSSDFWSLSEVLTFFSIGLFYFVTLTEKKNTVIFGVLLI